MLSLKEGELHFFPVLLQLLQNQFFFFLVPGKNKNKQESLPRAQHAFVEEGHVRTDCLGKKTKKKERCYRATLHNLYLHCRNPIIITGLFEEAELLCATFESIITPKRCKCQVSISLSTFSYQLDKKQMCTQGEQ